MFEHWLVIARCTLTIVPMRLCENVAEATTYGSKLTDAKVKERAQVFWAVSVGSIESVEAIQFLTGVPVLAIRVL